MRTRGIVIPELREEVEVVQVCIDASFPTGKALQLVCGAAVSTYKGYNKQVSSHVQIIDKDWLPPGAWMTSTLEGKVCSSCPSTEAGRGHTHAVGLLIPLKPISHQKGSGPCQATIHYHFIVNGGKQDVFIQNKHFVFTNGT